MDTRNQNTSVSKEQEIALRSLFIGPHSENDQFFEELTKLLVRDHLYWRKNLFANDPAAITAQESHEQTWVDTQDMVRDSLQQLSGKFKSCLPYFSPRYLGRRSSDLMITGALAKLIATLYSPENSEETPCGITEQLEKSVVRDFAGMMGYATNQCWGHLTADPATANIEALTLLRAVKYFPVAIRQGLKRSEIYIEHSSKAFKQPHEYNYWELSNFSIERCLHYRELVYRTVLEQFGEKKFKEFCYFVEQHRIETLGPAQFFADNYQLRPPVILVSAIEKPRWKKILSLVGIGHASLIGLPVNRSMQIDESELKRILGQLHSQSIPVLAVIGQLGNKAFGTIDPIHTMVKLRDSFELKGFSFYLHLDANWGGYLPTIIRASDGTTLPYESVRNQFDYLPSKRLYRDLKSVSLSDSITLDTSRMGYLSRENGLFLCKDKRIADFELLREWDHRKAEEQPLYAFGIEHSRTGAAAAAAWVTHKVAPLNCKGMGQYLTLIMQDTEHFFNGLKYLKKSLNNRVHVVVPFEPDSFVVTLAINPKGNQLVEAMNEFTLAVYENLKEQCGGGTHEYICSLATLKLEYLSSEESSELFKILRLDEDANPIQKNKELYILRHQLTSPWLSSSEQQDVIANYLDYLQAVIAKTADS